MVLAISFLEAPLKFRAHLADIALEGVKVLALLAAGVTLLTA